MTMDAVYNRRKWPPPLSSCGAWQTRASRRAWSQPSRMRTKKRASEQSRDVCTIIWWWWRPRFHHHRSSKQARYLFHELSSNMLTDLILYQSIEFFNITHDKVCSNTMWENGINAESEAMTTVLNVGVGRERAERATNTDTAENMQQQQSDRHHHSACLCYWIQRPG
jgi:hypothetical protein